MSILSHFRARRLAKEYVELIIRMEALTYSSLKELPDYYSTLQSLTKETSAQMCEVMERVDAAGPSVASSWRVLARQRLDNTKASAVFAALESVSGRLGKRIPRSTFSNNIPRDVQREPIDGLAIRLFKTVIDNFDPTRKGSWKTADR